MAKISGSTDKKVSQPKKTSIGCSSNSRPVSKNDRRIKKAYRGQGH